MKYEATLVLSFLLCGCVVGIQLPLLKRSLDEREIVKRATLPVGGSIAQYGQFYLPVQIGNPPVTYNLCLQTFSADVVLFDKSCQNCQRSQRYNPAASSGSKPVNCNTNKYFCDCGPNQSCIVHTSYSLVSANGTLYTDTLYWADSSVQITVGSLFSSYDDFVPEGMDGMIGFNTQLNSDWNGPSPFIEWAFRHSLPNTFSLCLPPEGATLTIGEDLEAPGNIYQWTDLINNYVPMLNLTVNGVQIFNEVKEISHFMVDSGATPVALPLSVYKNFANVLLKMCSTSNLAGICDKPKGKTLLDGYCYPVTAKEMMAYPPMTFYIDKIKPLVLSPEFYLLPYGNVTNNVCLGIQPVAVDYLPVIGVTFMQAFNVALNPFSSRIGFADLSTCTAKK